MRTLVITKGRNIRHEVTGDLSLPPLHSIFTLWEESKQLVSGVVKSVDVSIEADHRLKNPREWVRVELE